LPYYLNEKNRCFLNCYPRPVRFHKLSLCKRLYLFQERETFLFSVFISTRAERGRYRCYIWHAVRRVIYQRSVLMSLRRRNLNGAFTIFPFRMENSVPITFRCTLDSMRCDGVCTVNIPAFIYWIDRALFARFFSHI